LAIVGSVAYLFNAQMASARSAGALPTAIKLATL